MLFNLLLANKAIFEMFIVFKNILITSLLMRNTRLILAALFPTGVPVIVVNK